MDTEAILISLMILSMTAVFIIAYVKTRSFRVSIILMLIVGTKWTIILSMFGYDRTLLHFYLVNRSNPNIVKEVNITVCETIAATYIISLATALLWPYIIESLPSYVRRDIRKLISYEEAKQ